MNFYLMVILGILMFVYGIILLRKNNLVIPKSYELLLLGGLIFAPHSPNNIEIGNYISLAILYALVVLFHRRTYTVYNTDREYIVAKIRKLLDNNGIEYIIDEDRITLIQEMQESITVKGSQKNVRISFRKAKNWEKGIIGEIKEMDHKDLQIASYNGIGFVIVAIAYIATAYILFY